MEVNERRAFELFEQASDLGFFAAKFNLSMCYQHGVHVDKDKDRSQRLRREAFDGAGHFNILLDLESLPIMRLV